MRKRQIQVGLLGMNQDIISPQVNEKHAYEIKNFRINPTKDGNGFELTSERGMRFVKFKYKNNEYSNYNDFYKLDLSNINPNSNPAYYINGYCVLNGKIVLFICGSYMGTDRKTYKDD